MKKFEITNHTADIGINAYGNSVKELFENAAIALFEIMVESKKIKTNFLKSKKEIIKLNSSCLENLTHDWLSELLYIFNTKHIVFKKFKINRITMFFTPPCRALIPTKVELNAEVEGELFNPEKHIIKKEIKAVTYHNLEVENKNNKWKACVIFDI